MGVHAQHAHGCTCTACSNHTQNTKHAQTGTCKSTPTCTPDLDTHIQTYVNGAHPTHPIHRPRFKSPHTHIQIATHLIHGPRFKSPHTHTNRHTPYIQASLQIATHTYKLPHILYTGLASNCYSLEKVRGTCSDSRSGSRAGSAHSGPSGAGSHQQQEEGSRCVCISSLTCTQILVTSSFCLSVK